MFADSLTKECKYSEDLSNAVLENTFKLALSQFNQVKYSDGEIKMENRKNKEDLRASAEDIKHDDSLR